MTANPSFTPPHLGLSTTDAPLTTDLLCAKCHYNLRTKKPSELCPECAYPVADSIHFHRTAAIRNPKRAALGSLLLAFYFLQIPLFSLAFLILFKWLSLPPSTLLSRSFNIFPFLLDVAACAGFFLLRSALQSRPHGLASHLFAILIVIQTLLFPVASIVRSTLWPWIFFTPAGPSHDPWMFIVEVAPILLTFIIYTTAWWLLCRLARRINRPAFAVIISCIIPMYLMTLALDVLAEALFQFDPFGSIISYLPLSVFNVEFYFVLATQNAFILYWLALANLFRKIAPNPTPSPESPPVTIAPT